MCGIAGVIQPGIKEEQWPHLLYSMTDIMLHRGPDDAGVWYDAEAGVGLGHRRLSILDLSAQGHQPMGSVSGRYYITYNGEVYNFLSLKEELEAVGYSFHGNSDTEVILTAIEQWGLVEAVKRFNGMFAFALWDRKESILHLVRDRLGIKPLYYGWLENAFVFASELKAFKVHPNFIGEINRDALALMMRHNYIPSPYSIYKGIYKLTPGSILSIDYKYKRKDVMPVPYWSAKEVAEQGVKDLLSGPEEQLITQLDSILRDAIKLRMIADVPLGAFLSGGVDSSTVVALMQVQSERPVKTFSIGFYEADYNEAESAKAVAQYLGTDHTELYVTPEEAMAVIPKLPELYDEPFSDSSQIPTYLVSELARRQVAVSLSGDGGDELFGGYNRYFWGRSIWRKIGWMPGILRTAAAKSITTLPPNKWDALFSLLSPLLPERIKQRNPGDKAHKLAEILAVESPEALYHRLVSHWKEPHNIMNGASEPSTILTDRSSWADLSDFTVRMMYLDLVTYLPDDILTKVDRASMGVSLEARVPLLDYRVVEFAWRIPLAMKIKNGQGKWLLRQVLYKYVPKELIERPKMGFGVPIDRWLRGPLKEWAEELLNEERLKREGFFRPEPIRKLWREHLSGQRNWQYHLWDVLMFQAWLEKN